MRLAILYSPDLSKNYIVNYVNNKFNVVCKLAESTTKSQVIKRTLKRKNDEFISKLDKIVFYIYYYFFKHKKVECQLKETLKWNNTINPDITLNSINNPIAIEKIKQSKPDCIMVLGTSILKKHWLDLDIPIINIHSGITPYYRGRFCWFWPIYEKEFDKLGVVVHLVDEGVDTGKVIALRKIDLKKCKKPCIAAILKELLITICNTIDEALENIKLNEYPNTNNNITQHKIKLEPGIKAYFVFRKNFREYIKMYCLK